MNNNEPLKKVFIGVLTTAFYLFALYSFAWMWQHNKFESLKLHHAPADQTETAIKGFKSFSHANSSSSDIYSLIMPEYLKGYGNVTIQQNFDMYSDSEKKGLPHDTYSIEISAHLHLFQKTQYRVQLTYNGDFTKDNPEFSRGGGYFVDKDMNLIDPQQYTEKEINLYNAYHDKIIQQYQKCLDFYGKDNIEKL